MSENPEFNLNELTNENTNEDNVFALPNSQFNLPLRIKTFSAQKDFEQFVKNVERSVRSSIEYRLWVKYITEHLGNVKCALTQESMNECPVEIHHHPITLYTVVKGVINKILSLDQEFSTFDISLKAIELHFQNKVGYVTLIKSMHEKFHNGFLSIPKDYVKGDYEYFLNEYGRYIDEEDMDIINQRMAILESNCNWARNTYSFSDIAGEK